MLPPTNKESSWTFYGYDTVPFELFSKIKKDNLKKEGSQKVLFRIWNILWYQRLQHTSSIESRNGKRYYVIYYYETESNSNGPD